MTYYGRLKALGAAVAILLVAAAVLWLLPRAAEEYPLADLVPEDAILYAGFRDLREIDSLPRALTAPFLAKLNEARPYLAGSVAFYVDREGEWVALARLSNGDVKPVAQSDAALARHGERRRPLSENAEFRALRSRIFVNLERGRGDFSAIGLEVATVSPLVLRGRASYRREVYRSYLERRIHDPRQGLAGWATFTADFGSLWREALERLPEDDRRVAEREAAALSHDFLKDRDLESFLGELRPRCGVSVAPGGVLVAWVDLPDAAAAEALGRMLPKVGFDLLRHAKERNQPAPFELWREGTAWRVNVLRPWAKRLGAGFAPAWTVRENRLLFTTTAAVLDAPARAEGTAHVAAEIEIAPAVEAARWWAAAFEDADRVRGKIDAWGRRLEGVRSLGVEGHFTGGGLELEIRVKMLAPAGPGR